MRDSSHDAEPEGTVSERLGSQNQQNGHLLVSSQWVVQAMDVMPGPSQEVKGGLDLGDGGPSSSFWTRRTAVMLSLPGETPKLWLGIRGF